MDDEAPPELLEIREDALNASLVQPSPVPLTIITGFLGAGKSSLLQHILNAQHGYRIAVIMNEFADSADIEARTINVSSPDSPGVLSEEILELANGCLCCSIKDSGAAAIEKLLKRRGFDYILLETTGLADPGPIASMFWENESMSDAMYLDGIICVVDGMFGLGTEASEQQNGLASRQIAAADAILLNKCDIAPTLQLTRIAKTIASVNHTARVFRTTQGVLDDLGQILNLHAYSSAPPRLGAHTMGDEGGAGDHGHDYDHDDSREHEYGDGGTSFGGVSSLVIPIPALSSEQASALDEWLRTVIWEKRIPSRTPANEHNELDVLRCKGVYTIQGNTRTYVIQGVRTLYDTKEIQVPKGKSEGGKIVLIGTLGDNRELIIASLLSTLRDVN